MRSLTAYGESRLLFWQRVREFAVPPSMIEAATARRAVGDWAGACAAAHIDIDLDLRAAARAYGREVAAQVRADLRRLAPDLLRWHMPRIAPDGLLRPGLTTSLASYPPAGPADGAVHLVARTPPVWADGGQRISLALWAGPGRSRGASSSEPRRSGKGWPRWADGSCGHPHPRPDRRFRLDLHRHLWDAHRSGDLRERAGAGQWAAEGGDVGQLDPMGLVPAGIGCAVDRWASEAAIVLRSQGRDGGAVTVRLGARRRLVLHVGEQGDASGPPALHIAAALAGQVSAGPAGLAGAGSSALAGGGTSVWPELPDAATWVLPDLALLRAGLIDADWLHPLVAAALAPGRAPARVPLAAAGAGPRLVECRGAQHRIGLVDGVLVALDHDPAEIGREALLVALGGTPLPCLRVIDDAHRHPECLAEVRARLDHGDAAGALAAVEDLLGPDALLRSGGLRDELERAARRRVTHGLYRAGLAGAGPIRVIRGSQRRELRRRLRYPTSC